MYYDMYLLNSILECVMTEQRLLGYQVKRLDQLIEAAFDRAVAAVGMSRREWQTLTAIRRGPATAATLDDALRPFWAVDGESVAAVVTALTDRGWITVDEHARYVLTEPGAAAHAHAAPTVGAVRGQLADGISEAEFATVTVNLARMIDNLDTAR